MTAADDRVREALTAMPVIDGHNDLPMALRAKTGYSVEGLDRLRPEFHTDLTRLRAGGVGAQFWSVYVDSSLPAGEAVVATMEQIDAVYRMVARYPDQLRMAYTADDIEGAFAHGQIASLLGVEGGHSIADSLGTLRGLARLGIRYMTLTHNDNTAWADSATDEPGVGGLNDEGRAVVAELNRIGVLVDISHTAASTQKAALAASTAPVIFSHSSAKALSAHPRNVDDDVLGLLAQAGGMIMVTFVPPFISEAVASWIRESSTARARFGVADAVESWPRAPRPGESAEQVAAELAAQQDQSEQATASADYADWLKANPRPAVTIADVADHVEHAREVAGIAHIGLGGDYDGVSQQPTGLEDVSGYPRLLAELAERGWSASDLEALTGRNILRVLRAAEEVASEPLWPGAPAIRR